MKMIKRTAVAALLVTSSAAAIAAGPTATTTIAPQTLTASHLTQSGRIRAFWGRLRPFELTGSWANSSAFSSNDAELSQFWARMRPFGRLRAFWEGGDGLNGVSPLWRRIRGFWGEGEYATTYRNDLTLLQSNFDQFLLDARLFWDPLMQDQTRGQENFDAFFAKFQALMKERHGLEFTTDGKIDANIIKDWDAEKRARFIVEWYDQLMQYSGADQVDHWMRTTNWTPAITDQQGGGKDVKIGLLDSLVSGDADLLKKITVLGTGKLNQYSDGHGAAVASLLVSSHDGKGVMGVSPNAQIVAYNPYEADGSATWSEVGKGLRAVAKDGASVINLSLGVPGYTLHPDWNAVLSSVSYDLAAAVLVFAAGNDGITQKGIVEWDRLKNAPLIVVGSATADGTLSDFSNRPGTTCLAVDGRCFEMLYNRFIVAPGELVLVSDDKGGVTRFSGTSFAAPLVAGTVALIQDRWPWLKKYPVTTADIILNSATKIAGSTPEQTGRGMLNIAGAMSPLSWDVLTYYEYTPGQPDPVKKSASMLKSGGLQTSAWETKGMYLTAFEKLGSTHRDFAIPLSSKLVNQTILMNGSQEQFQHYLYGRFTDWMNTGTTTTTTKRRFAMGVSSTAGAPDGVQVTTTVAPANPVNRFREGAPLYQLSVAFSVPNDALTFNLGHGDGSVALVGQTSFGLFSDYDTNGGGVNPILGFASGGNYGNMEVKLADNVTLSAGATERRTRGLLHKMSLDERQAYVQSGAYKSAAVHVSVHYDPADTITLGASYTKLDEADGLLGIQSVDDGDFRGGSTTDAATVSADLRLAHGIGLATSATLARTREGDVSRQALAVSQGGLKGTAFSIALSKTGFLGKHDRVRLSLSQPLFIENGYLDFSQMKVVDRETGEIGMVTERFEVSDTRRPWVAEFLYGATMSNGQAHLAAFGRAEQRSMARGGERDFMAGARLSFGF